jgi:hypothetical protein
LEGVELETVSTFTFDESIETTSLFFSVELEQEKKKRKSTKSEL